LAAFAIVADKARRASYTVFAIITCVTICAIVGAVAQHTAGAVGNKITICVVHDVLKVFYS
jgi:hypothetical protein